MPAPAPTQDDAIRAVVNTLNAMSPLPGTVLHFEANLDSELEFIEQYQRTDGTLDLWLVDSAVRSEEGPATGEIYSFYDIRLRYLSLRLDDENWNRDALHEAERVRTALEGNLNVFAINSQRQVRTPETVEYDGGYTVIDGQMYYQVTMRLTVEARRWA